MRTFKNFETSPLPIIIVKIDIPTKHEILEKASAPTICNI